MTLSGVISDEWHPFRYVRGIRKGWIGRARKLPSSYDISGIIEVNTRDGYGWMKTMKFNRNCEWHVEK